MFSEYFEEKQLESILLLAVSNEFPFTIWTIICLIEKNYFTTNNDSVVYTDLIRKFPVTFIEGNKYIILLYHYDSNTIIIKSLKNISYKESS